MRTCTCQICQRSDRIDLIVERGNVSELREMVRELQDSLCHTEDELNYRMAILDGSWPSAVELLMNALFRAFKHRDEEMARELERKQALAESWVK